MFSKSEFQQAAKGFEPVLHYYDGLKGGVIKWSLENGNTNHDPSVLIWILDPKGKVIEKCSSASGAVSFMKKHSQASFPLVDPASFEHMSKEAKTVAARKSLGQVMAKLRTVAAGGEGIEIDKQKEAELLLTKVQGFANWKIKRAKELESSGPADALAMYKELSKQFKGDKIGSDAKAVYDRLRKDKSFKAEIAAAKLLTAIKEIGKKFKPAKYKGKINFADAAFKKKNAKLLGQAAGYLKMLLKKYPNTKAAAKAKKLQTEWKLG